jgi:uncharacterized membrane protein
VDNPFKLKIPRTPFERVLQVIAAASVVALLIFVRSVWSQLPETVPTHFGVGGSPDAWGSRDKLLALPILAVLIFLVLSVVEVFPQTYNYPVSVTAEKLRELYQRGRQLILIVKVIVILSLAFIVYASVKIALGQWAV